jgi:hypothetical protein
MTVKMPVATREYSDYTLYPDLAETAVQGAAPTESYGNFGLTSTGARAIGFAGVGLAE